MGVGSLFLKKGEVGVVAGGEAAFVWKAEAVGDVAGGLRKEVEGVVEEEGETVLDAGDAAPHLEDIVAGFEVGGGGRMVGADGVNFVAAEAVPEGGDGFGGAEWGGAFGEGADAVGGGVVEEKVVGAGFDGDIEAGFFCGGDEGDSFGAGDVNDVEGAAGFGGEFDGEGDGVGLESGGAGVEPVLHGGADGRGAVGDFGMDRDGEVEVGGDLHAFAQGGSVGGGVFVETGVTHEGFEADGSGLGHGGEMRKGGGDEASPEGEIEMGFLEGGGFFEFERFVVGDGWGGIERHVEEGSASSGGEGEGAGGEAFPIGAAGFVEVDVRVDPARDKDAIGGIDFDLGGAGDVFGEVGDGAVRGSERLNLTVGEGGVDEEVVVWHGMRLGEIFLPRRTPRIGL